VTRGVAEPDHSSSAGLVLAKLADLIAPLAVAAVLLARIAPSETLSRDSGWLLAVLVLLTAVQIDSRDLARLRRRLPIIVTVAVGVLLADTALAYGVSRPFHGATQQGVLSLGLASTEVASVGLIGLAGGSLHILGTFALAVLLPLAIGLALRRARPRLQRVEAQANGLSALAVCALLYAAVSGVTGGHELLVELLGGVGFLLAASALGALLARALRPRGFDPSVVVFTTGLRDFAVAATLARQAFGPAAAGVGGVYGALMLLAGALAATVLRRRAAA
jgi:hypothetical protein